MYCWFVNAGGYFFYAGKTHDRPLRGVFRGSRDFFTPKLSWAQWGVFRRGKKVGTPSKNPRKWPTTCLAGIQKITSQTFRISGTLVILRPNFDEFCFINIHCTRETYNVSNGICNHWYPINITVLFRHCYIYANFPSHPDFYRELAVMLLRNLLVLFRNIISRSRENPGD